MSNAGGWEMTALAMGLMEQRALPTGVATPCVHPALANEYGGVLVTSPRPIEGHHAVKVMLGIGGITACVALARP
jgi:hypothetical protein